MGDGESLIKDLNGEYENFFGVLMTLSDGDKTEIMLGTWAIRDVVVHVGAWLREMTGALERLARGERPTPEGVDYGDFDAWNARWVAESKGKSVGQVEAELHAAKEDFVGAMRALPDDRFAEGKTAWRMVHTSGIDHFKEHAAQMWRWKSQKGAGRPVPPGMPREAVG